MIEVLERLLTYTEYREMEFEEDDDSRYELLEGLLMQKGSPTIQHQRISGNIYFRMRLFLEEKTLGEVFSAPLDVVLDEHNAPQPDVFFVGKDRKYIIDEAEQVVFGVPSLVVEVISPGSVRKDRILKKRVYEQFQIPEYWIVDPSYKSIEVYRFEEGRYEVFDSAEGIGSVKSSVMEGFELELSKVF